MPLGTEVGLNSGHIVLDGDPAPSSPKGGHNPANFGPYLLWPNGWMDQDATWYVLYGDPAPYQKGGHRPPISAHDYLAKRPPISATAEYLL